MARVKLNNKGFAELLKDDAVRADLLRRAERIRAACGEGYEAASSEPRTRSRAAVFTRTNRAKEDSSNQNTMVKNLDRGR